MSRRIELAGGTSIEWTDYTFNPWWGCVRVSPACNYCYAERLAKRTGHDVWGRHAGRRLFGADHWNEPKQWGDWLPYEHVHGPFWEPASGGPYLDGHELAPEIWEDQIVRGFMGEIGDVYADARGYVIEEADLVWEFVGKAKAGRVLDGRTWDERPQPLELP